MVMVPAPLATGCRRTPEGRAWLERLPQLVETLRRRWSLSLGRPFDAYVSCAWVAPALQSDGTPSVLKLGMPHMEAAHELHALRLWAGEGAVRLLDADEDANAMLLERCEPGDALRDVPGPEQDVVIAGLLRRLWRMPMTPHPFRPLAVMLAEWARETNAAASGWADAPLVRQGLELFDALARPSGADVLLATDLHAGNVLRARREPWLAIDPKPFVGDRAYDATQHLLNCRQRLIAAPERTIYRIADLFEVDAERVRLWLFARAAAEPRDDWHDERTALAKVLGRACY